jgi:hypothetical protein
LIPFFPLIVQIANSPRIPNAFNGFGFTCRNAGGTIGFGFAGATGVLYFFAVIFGDGGNGFIFKVNELCFQFNCFLRAFFCALTTAAAFV